MNSMPHQEAGNSEPDPSRLGEGIGLTPKVSKQASEEVVLKQKKQSERIALVRKLVPSKVGVFERAYTGKSLRAAINANCLDCQGYEQAEVKRCQILDCTFHSLRPYQASKAKGENS